MGLKREEENEIPAHKKMKYELIRFIMQKAGGRFVTMDFTKQDGTLRTINVQPAAAKTKVKGEKNTKQMKDVIKKRASNNPHLLNVWDVQKKAFRSVNMDTVSRVKFMGNEIRWEV